MREWSEDLIIGFDSGHGEWPQVLSFSFICLVLAVKRGRFAVSDKDICIVVREGLCQAFAAPLPIISQRRRKEASKGASLSGWRRAKYSSILSWRIRRKSFFGVLT